MNLYSSSEVKSGIFVTISLIILFALTFVVGNFMSGARKNYVVRFGYISGLEDNAPVYFAGREVGKVTNIQVKSGDERPIVVHVSIREDIQLRQDTDAFVDTLGLMGEKFVELTTGSMEAGILAPGGQITGTDPIAMHVLIRKMNLLADRMDELTTSLNPLMTTVSDAVAGHEEEIAKTISNIHETSANIRDMTHDLKFRPWRLVRKG